MVNGLAAILWWFGIAVLYLVVIPLVAFLAHRLLRPIREIKLYSDDINSGVAQVGSNIAALTALTETQEKLVRLGPVLARTLAKLMGSAS